MGNSGSLNSSNYQLQVSKEVLEQFHQCGMQKRELNDLYKIFDAIDSDKSGEIDAMEFFTYIDLCPTRFAEKAFTVMDKDGNGTINFTEFILSIYKYCTLTHSSLVAFAFDLYDFNGSGQIELEEASRCIREVWGSNWEQYPKALKVMECLERKIESSPTRTINLKNFHEFAKNHPIMLFPAFQLQSDIQKRVLGKKFWARAATRRQSLQVQSISWKTLQKMEQKSLRKFEGLGEIEDQKETLLMRIHKWIGNTLIRQSKMARDAKNVLESLEQEHIAKAQKESGKRKSVHRIASEVNFVAEKKANKTGV